MKVIAIINIVGVGVLAILCAVQGEVNRRLHLSVIALETANHQQGEKIAAQEQAIKGYQQDLDDFRQRLEKTIAALKQTESKVTSLAAERDRLSRERDHALASVEQAKSAITQWSAALAQRDGVIRQANAQILQLANDRNAAVARFNDLAGKYNGVVNEINAAHAKQASGR